MKKTLILVFIAVMVSFAVSYAQKNETVTYQDFIEGKMAFSLGNQKFPLCFVSAAEAGWPEVTGGSFIEEKIAPEWLKVSYRTSNIFHCLLKKLIILQNPRRNILLRSVRSRKDSIVPIKSEQPFTDRLLFGIGRR